MTDPAPLDAPEDPNLRRAALALELEALYGSHYGRLVGYFRRHGQPEAVAQELAQDSFVQALRKLDQFQGGAKLSTWLWTIAGRMLLSLIRRGDEAEPSQDALNLDAATLMVSEDAHLNPQIDCIRRGFARFAAQHPERAHALYLAEVEEFSSQELALMLGRTVRATEEYLSQCRIKLRPFIQNCCEP